MTFHSLKEKGPSLLVGISILTALLGLILNTPFTDIIFSVSMILLFFAWLTANLFKYNNLENINEKMRIKKTMVAMSLCVSLGVLMLAYYEYQIPKYHVAKIKKELYRVPPQLSKNQLIELGRECNTYGNTLCSHDVFARAVKMDPRDYTSLANLAMAQSHLGFHQYAIINFDRAIQNGAKTFDIFKFYGNSLLNLDKKGLAIESYKKSLKLNPKQQSLQRKIESLEQLLSSEI